MVIEIILHQFYLIIVFLFSLQINLFSQEFFNYSKYLFDPPSTLSLNIEEINRTTGYVRVNGYCFRRSHIYKLGLGRWYF